MKRPQEEKKRDSIKTNSPENAIQNSESGPCACCAVFFSDYAVQELEQRWNNGRALRQLINELLEEGFGHLAKPILWRWHKLVPKSPEYSELLCKITDQIWVAGSSKTIHDFDKPMADADIERAVAHDMALLEHSWRKKETDQKPKFDKPRPGS